MITERNCDSSDIFYRLAVVVLSTHPSVEFVPLAAISMRSLCQQTEQMSRSGHMPPLIFQLILRSCDYLFLVKVSLVVYELT